MQDEEPIQHISSSEILSIAKEIQKSRYIPEQKLQVFKEKYKDFYDLYPILFEMCCKESFEIHQLKYMLSMRDAVEKNKLSQHDASVKVGQRLVDRYVPKDIPE